MDLTLRDPIHGSVVVEAWARPLVDSAVVQRLRRIHQLGTAHLVYPGAHHRRFEHSLGAHHLARRLAQAVGLDADEVRTVAAAALLHDVGHGPFSHAFEELLREAGHRHEAMSQDLVRWGPLADLLRQNGLDPVRVADAIVGQGRGGRLVAGSLDADRADYLLRDAHYTGVRSNVDPDRLAEVLVLHGDEILLRPSGLLAAEAILTTRFLMYPTVYLHHTVRSTEATLQAAIRAHIADGHASLIDLERETDDGLLWQIRSAGGHGASLVRRLDERRLLKRAWEVGPERAEDPAILELQRPARRRSVAAEIAHAADVPEHEVLLDVPHAPRFRELGLRVDAPEGPVELSSASRLVAVLQDARLDHWRAWVFAPRAHLDRVGRAAERILGPGAPSLRFK